MKIVHLALQAPYNEGWGYQENLLTKYQAQLGHQVTLITTNTENRPGGTFEVVPTCDYVSPDGFRVVRLEYERKWPRSFFSIFKQYKIEPLLEEIKPDFIMVHGLGSFSVLRVAKYLKQNPQCKVIADNHLDYNIGAPLLAKRVRTALYRKAVRWLNKKMQPYYSKVYGVTPWRCEFANEIFGINKQKLDVLPAGADDAKIDFAGRDRIRAEIRQKHNVPEHSFLIVTGGKIDKKKNIHLLMQAVSEMDRTDICLVVFGDPAEEVKPVFEQLAHDQKIRQIGWISADDTYNYFLAADLVFFPGQHSVMWEQTVACGTPCVFRHFHGMHHCDIGGNCRFLYEDNTDAIKVLLEDVLKPENYAAMYQSAHSEESKKFLYSCLAVQSLETSGRND